MRSRPLLRSCACVLGVVSVSACTLLSGASDLVVESAGPSSDAKSETEAGLAFGPDAPAGEDAATDAGPRDAATLPDAPSGCTSTPLRYATKVEAPGWDNAELAAGAPDTRSAEYDPTSQTLVASDYGLSIPAGASIAGIVVRVRRKSSGLLGSVSVTLGRGVNRAQGGWPLSSDLSDVTYGSPTDTWDASWKAADVTAASFGVSIALGGFGTAAIDSVGVSVTYCP